MCFNECKRLEFLMQALSIGRINFGDTPYILPTPNLVPQHFQHTVYKT